MIDAGDDSMLHMVRSTVVKGKVAHRETQWAKQLPLNKSNPDLLINYIGQSDLTSDGVLRMRPLTHSRTRATTLSTTTVMGNNVCRLF